MTMLEGRLAKLESRAGGPDDLWRRSLSEEELEARIDELTIRLTAQLQAQGRTVPNSEAEWAELTAVEMRRSRPGPENNQVKSE